MLEEHDLEVVVSDYAIASGSYQDESGGVFLSDGSLVAQDQIEEFWFGDAWTDKKGGEFDKKEVDFDLDYDDLPESDSVQGKTEASSYKQVLTSQEDEPAEIDGVSDGTESDNVVGTISDAELEVGSIGQENLDAVQDVGVDNVSLNFGYAEDSDDSVFTGGPTSRSSGGNDGLEVFAPLDDGESVELGDLLSNEEDLQGLLSDGEVGEANTDTRNTDFDSISLEENLKLDLDDGDNGEAFD